MHFSVISVLGFSSLAAAQLDLFRIHARAAQAGPGAQGGPAGPGGAGGQGGPGGPGGPEMCYKYTPDDIKILESEPRYPDNVRSAVRVIAQTMTEPPPFCGPPPVTGPAAAAATSVYNNQLSWRDASSAALLSLASKVDAACGGDQKVQDFKDFQKCQPAGSPQPTFGPDGFGAGGGTGSGPAPGGAAPGGAGSSPPPAATGGSGAPTGGASGAGGAGAKTSKGANDVAATTSSASLPSSTKAAGNGTAAVKTSTSNAGDSMKISAMAAGGLAVWAMVAMAAL